MKASNYTNKIVVILFNTEKGYLLECYECQVKIID